MAEMTEFELVSPARLLIAQPAEMVVVPGSEGDFGALPRHSPMITGLRPGTIDVYAGGKVEKRIFVAGGFAEVNESRITVLAEEAIMLNEITSEAAEQRLREAQAALAAAQGETAKNDAHKQVAVAQALLAALA